MQSSYNACSRPEKPRNGTLVTVQTHSGDNARQVPQAMKIRGLWVEVFSFQTEHHSYRGEVVGVAMIMRLNFLSPHCLLVCEECLHVLVNWIEVHTLFEPYLQASRGGFHDGWIVIRSFTLFGSILARRRSACYRSR